MFVLSPDAENLRFPPTHLASPDGLLAIGGDLRNERLLQAYRQGVFPWYNSGQPILWWSPDPRTVLFPHKLRISHSLRKTLRKEKFQVTLDADFREVINGCAGPRRANPDGDTWITTEMLQAYCRLHEQGYAHSVETWLEEKIVGGLYGVALGGAFFGESMFSRITDASKVAFVSLVRQLEAWGYTLIDCQLRSAHLLSLGAQELPRKEFLIYLDQALIKPSRSGPWRLELDPACIA
ncbi:MAG TPA: leucyl/phenylalanyl-tRNA--protein transferase [Acidiferrobacterales bacterium]|nr:leucyl/phenylalanyl-tRNA--protein transferase [Acidiferrobacterales bacterium]